MSEKEEATDMKGGHAPAVKVGGMRVVSHKPVAAPAASGDAAEKPKEDPEEYLSDPKPDKHHQSILISGAVTKGDKDFTPEAVQHYHNKPQPTAINRPPPNMQKQNMHIHQPR